MSQNQHFFQKNLKLVLLAIVLSLVIIFSVVTLFLNSLQPKTTETQIPIKTFSSESSFSSSLSFSNSASDSSPFSFSGTNLSDNQKNSFSKPQFQVSQEGENQEILTLEACDLKVKYVKNDQFSNSVYKEKLFNQFELEKVARGVAQSGNLNFLIYCGRQKDNFEKIVAENGSEKQAVNLSKEVFCLQIKRQNCQQEVEKFVVSRDPKGQFPDNYYFTAGDYFYLITNSGYTEIN